MSFGKPSGWKWIVTVLITGSSGSPSAGWTSTAATVHGTSNSHEPPGAMLSHAAGASSARLPSTSSLMLSSTRFGLSFELVFVTLMWYVTWSPIFESPSPFFVISTRGWNRLTEWLSLSVTLSRMQFAC
jgi:hypothetical protein